MPDDLVTLECPKCGAGLDIYPDTKTLVCHQCALAIEVNRRNGCIALNGVTPRIMEVRPWPEQLAAESSAVKVEEALQQLRDSRRRLIAKVRRRRWAFGLFEGIGVLIVLLGGAWIVRDKDSATQTAMVIFLGGAVLLGGLIRYFGRDNPWTWRWARRWPWSWRPDEDEAATMRYLNAEIARLGTLLLEKRR